MQDNQQPIPVYLFLGLLEAGKTQFIQKMLESEQFSSEENVLLLVCEEGIEEYDTSRFPKQNVFVQIIDSPDELTRENLQRLSDECHAGRIFVEYNGMWHLKYLITGKPRKWMIFQTVLIAEAAGFLQFYRNFRSLVTDKLSVSDLVYFNRFEGKAEPIELHKIVRSVNRRTKIYYEFDNGQNAYDDIVDPLPFILEADPVVIPDEHYSVWYQDIADVPEQYAGKTVQFKAMLQPIDGIRDDIYAVGREIMTCCIEDMQFCGFAAQYRTDAASRPMPEQWFIVTAKVQLEQDPQFHENFPVLEIIRLKEADAPEDDMSLAIAELRA